MKHVMVLTVLTIVFAVNVATAGERRLHGQVLQLSEENRQDPATKNIKVIIDEIGTTEYTQDNGQFTYFLRDRDRPGKEITFRIMLDGFVVHEPVDGLTHIPKDSELDTLLRLVLAKKGSPVLLSQARFNRSIEAATSAAKDQVKLAKDGPPTPVTLDLNEIAARLGFTIEVMRQWVLTQAAQLERSPNLQARARAAAAQNDFRKAGDLEMQAMDRLAETYARARPLKQHGPLWLAPPIIVHLVDNTRPPSAEELEQLALKLVKGYWFAGDSYYNANKFEQALESYQRAARYVSKEDSPKLWAEIQIDIGRATALRGEPYDDTRREAGIRLLAQAVEAFRAALTIYTKDASPRDWARTQNYLGVTLKVQGLKSRDETRAKLLGEAVNAFRAALTVYTKEAFPQDWARTQENLGSVLQEVIHHGQADVQLFAQAVEAYRAALTVYTKEAIPHRWAETHRLLAHALNLQSIYTRGEAGSSLLHEAMASYRQAQTIYTRETDPAIWNSLQANLIQTQDHLGYRLKNEAADALEGDRARLLEQAISAYREALTITIDVDYGGTDRQETFIGLAEALFLNSQFMEASHYLAALQHGMAVYPDLRLALLPIVFANSVALGTGEQAEAELGETSSLLSHKSDPFHSPLGSFLFTDFRATKIFIETNPIFRDHRHWLIALIEAVMRDGRDQLQTAIQNARAALRKDPKS